MIKVNLPRTRPPHSQSDKVKSKLASKKPTKTTGLGIGKKGTPIPPSIEGGRGSLNLSSNFHSENENHVNELKFLLRTLPTKLKKELSDYLLLELVVQSKSPDRQINIWIDCILFHLRRVLPVTSTSIHTRNPIYKTFVASHEEILRFTLSTDMPELTIAQRSSWYNLLAEMLVKHCANNSKKYEFPLSLKYVLQSSNLISGLFENAYPGYLRSGLMRVIINKLQPIQFPTLHQDPAV